MATTGTKQRTCQKLAGARVAGNLFISQQLEALLLEVKYREPQWAAALTVSGCGRLQTVAAPGAQVAWWRSLIRLRHYNDSVESSVTGKSADSRY